MKPRASGGRGQALRGFSGREHIRYVESSDVTGAGAGVAARLSSGSVLRGQLGRVLPGREVVLERGVHGNQPHLGGYFRVLPCAPETCTFLFVTSVSVEEGKRARQEPGQWGAAEGVGQNHPAFPASPYPPCSPRSERQAG